MTMIFYFISIVAFIAYFILFKNQNMSSRIVLASVAFGSSLSALSFSAQLYNDYSHNFSLHWFKLFSFGFYTTILIIIPIIRLLQK